MSKPRPDFTMEELIKELQDKLPDMNERGARTIEIASALNVSPTTARKMLRRLMDAGRLEVVRKEMERLDRQTTRVSAYIITPRKEEGVKEENVELG